MEEKERNKKMQSHARLGMYWVLNLTIQILSDRFDNFFKKIILKFRLLNLKFNILDKDNFIKGKHYIHMKV